MIDWLGWLRRLEFTAVAAIAIAGLSLVLGQSAQQLTETTAPRLAAGATPGPADSQSIARLNVIDYATTGSIKGRTVLMSPCKAQD
jgi:hypothetical protein